MPAPTEPLCSGYSARLDDSLNLIVKGEDAAFDAIAAREYVKYEKAYAADRKLQTQYLGLRLWAFFTGTDLPKLKQAQMAKDKAISVNVSNCVVGAKKNNEAFKKVQEYVAHYKHKELSSPEAVCEAFFQ